MKRRDFVKRSAMSAAGFAIIPHLLFSCSPKENELFFQISLAQWSLHRTLQAGQLTTLDFPAKTRNDFGLDGIEFVNQFFPDKAKDMTFLKELKTRCKDNRVNPQLIMIDNEGHLSSNDTKQRALAIDNHKKWVDAAKEIGCHSIRVNLHGEGTEQEWKEASIDGLGKLAEYGADNKINVIAENHGQWSSKGNLMAEIMQQIDSKYAGTLPDFGNFCIRRRDGDMWVSPCVETYDAYKGVDEMMPYAKGVSAKTFGFDSDGNDTTTNYKKMLEIVKKHEYKGYIGIEYEGEDDDEDKGIKQTIALLKRVGGQVA